MNLGRFRHAAMPGLLLSLLLSLLLGCGGPTTSAPPAELPDEAPPPARAVPEASTLVRQGEARLQANDVKGAQALFEQALEQDPKDPRALLDLGITFEAQNDATAAEAAYRRAVEAKADFAEALNNLGVLLREQGKLGDARTFLERAAQANPRSVAAQMNLALVMEDQQDFAGAERAYRAAVALDDGNAMLRANLGLLLVAQEKMAEGRTELLAALDKAQGNRAALLAIGNGLRRAGDAQGALRAMQEAVQAESEVTAALLAELALAHRAAAARAAPPATLERALALDARYATAHYLLGNMLAGANRFDEAKKHYERYLQLEPKGQQAAQARERLQMVKQARKK